MQYRAEVDGLRAIAVMSVIFFHAGFDAFEGGFAGVDVFFVISGYLITSIIISEIEKKKFSLSNFYERRARRIFPALYCVIFLSLPIALMWLPQENILDFSKSTLSVITFLSNYYFLSGTGYFATASELKPLLHTWSLAVEEQFYIIFPVSLMLIWSLGLRWVSFILFITLFASFGLAYWGAQNWPVAAFFILPTRIWELLTGSLIAIYLYKKNAGKYKSFKYQNSLSIIGFLMIFYSVFFIDENSNIPGPPALVSVLGTALIIVYANQNTLVHYLLSRRVLVGIGLISYSAYLWHQPLMVFVRHRHLTEPSVWLMLFLCLATLAAGYVSWRFIEKPFRNNQSVSRNRFFTIFALSSILVMCFGLSSILNNGFPSRFQNINTQELDTLFAANHGLSISCSGTYTEADECSFGDGPAELLLWGDSYAMHLAQALKTGDQKINFRQHTLSSCRPIFGISVRTKTEKWQRRCLNQNRKVLDWVKQNPSVKFAILGSPFTFGNKIVDTNMQETGSERENLIPHFKETVNTLLENGVKPIFVAPPPQTHFDIGSCVKKAILYDVSSKDCSFQKAEVLPVVLAAYSLLEQVKKFAPVLELEPYICSQGTCHAVLENHSIYRDSGHLSKQGSAYLGEKHNIVGKAINMIEHFEYENEPLTTE